MAHEDLDDPTDTDAEDGTIGMRLHRVMAAVSEVAHNAENRVELDEDPTGHWSVAADTLWQVKAMVEGIMSDLGVKTPDDLRKIQAHDYPPGAAGDDDGKAPF